MDIDLDIISLREVAQEQLVLEEAASELYESLLAKASMDDIQARLDWGIEQLSVGDGDIKILYGIKKSLREVGWDRAEMKPCPFCGHKPTFRLSETKHCQLHGEPYQDNILGCFSPHCSMGPQKLSPCKSALIDDWNKRVET